MGSGPASTVAPHAWSFASAPLPRVVRASPPDADRPGRLELFFSSPMDRDAVREQLRLEPQPDFPPSFAWNDDDTRLSLWGASRPATRYTLTLPAGIKDRFGRALADAFQLTFTTPPAPPQAWLVSPSPIGAYNAYGTPRAVVRTTNVTALRYRLEQLDADQFARIAAEPGRREPGQAIGQFVRAWEVAVASEPDVPKLTTVDLLGRDGGPLPPGYYHLEVRPNEARAGLQETFFVVTRTAVTVKETERQVLVWAVDLQSGRPLAGLPVRLLGSGRVGLPRGGSTDADGLLRLELPAPASPRGKGPAQPLLALVERPDDAALGSSAWSAGISPWDFRLPAAWYPSEWVAHLYTDRPIYRPGQVVHLKGILRADDDARYALPPSDLAATWTATDGQGRAVASGRAALGEFGTFSADLELSAEAATGNYHLQLKVGEQFIAAASFQVAEYRRPEFEVSVAPVRPGVVSGEEIAATAHAAYYFGRPIAGAAVRWRVTAEPWTFTWKAEPGFRFGEPDALEGRVEAPARGPRAEGKGSVAADGSFAVRVPTDLSKDRSSQRFTLEATVTDLNDQEVSARAPVVVHKAGLYLGLEPEQFVAQAGQAQSVALVTLDPEGTPLANIPVHAQVFARKWLSVRQRDADGELRWLSRPEDTPVATLDLRSDSAGRGAATFTPAGGGEYRVVVDGRDAAGNAARTAVSLWVAGPGFIPWRMGDHDRLELQADRAEYRPGEVARVIVPAPVADALALVTVERGRLLSQRVQRLADNSAVLEIPLGAEHVPNAYVSVVLFKGGQTPVFRVGYVELPVSADEQRLQVRIEADRKQVQPGERVGFALKTLDAAGKGVPAEVSLALVDAAVLALADDRAGDPVQAFWKRRGLGVRTGATAAVSIDRLIENVTSGKKGGDGGGAEVSVRSEFRDTAFWQPSVRTDAVGVARVEISLPDNLTTWRLTALAVTRDTRLGLAASEVVTAKPLLLRPVAPRFLVAGDQARLGAVVHNTTAGPLRVPAALRASGSAVVAGDPARTLELPAGGQARVDWSLTAGPAPGEAVLHFEVGTAPGPRDAVELRLPVLPWGTAATVATAGEVGPADTATEVVEVPRYADRERGELAVEVAPSLAAAMRYALRHVEEFEYECLEQTVSRFLPRLALYRAIDGLGLGDPLGLKDQLPGLVTRSLQRIYRYQHGDGGWGWWRDDASQPYLTAYALFGLVEAQRAGFSVDRGVVDRAQRYLRDWLNGDPGVFGLDVRAYVLYVLGEAGAPEPGRAAALYDRRAELGPTARAYLAQALARADKTDGRVGGLLADLTAAAVTSATGSHWEEARPDPWSFSTGTRATAAVLDALVRLRPDHPLVASAVRWLMAARRDGHWESTQETAQSLLALTDYLAASGELRGDYRWALSLNGAERAAGRVEAATRAETTRTSVPTRELRAGANRVELARGPGQEGRLYYTLQFRSYAPTEEVPAEAHGLTVAREYLPLEGDGGPLASARVGEIVRVRLTVLAPADLHHLILEDPLPAGLEPLDPSLKITTVQARETLEAAQRAKTPDGWWRWPRWTHVDVRDRKVALFASYLPKGTHEYTYLARASIAGTYRVLPASAYEQYFPEVFARTDGRRFYVAP